MTWIHTRTVALASASLLMLGACFEGGPGGVDPLPGEWRALDAIGNYHNSLYITRDLVGSGTVYFYLDGELFYATYLVVAMPIETGYEYRLDMLCDGECSSFDFSMSCQMFDGQRLDCSGDAAFSDYGALEYELTHR